MRLRAIYLCSLLIFTGSCFLPITVYAHTFKTIDQRHSTAAPENFPTVDPNYIYDQLFLMATHFQRRETGYDTNLPAQVNGHDEFADYWAKEMVHNLQGFGAQIQRDTFPVTGWQKRPARVPAFNVEVSVPGATHPEQVVVIGCHYDGEAVSTQSANDDASGCAIELGVAKALGNFWRSQQVYPARTLRFVIFDAEEQGLYGSFHYLNNTVNGDAANIVAMFNEEQSGIAYPLRYLGKLSNPLLPFYIEVSPRQNNQLYPQQSRLSQAQHDAIASFRALMQQAIPAVFQRFQALGYQGLTYHAANKQDVPQPIFTPEQRSSIVLEDDQLGGSDQIPFTLAGLPCATFAGNSTYYNDNPPAWSYPFDQKEDTIQLMNTFASGSSKKSYALTLALALPGMLTTWMLNQPAVLGQTAANALPAGPLATISDIGQTQVGKKLTLDGKTSYDIQATPLTYTWDFGDGSKASGITVSHTYTTASNPTLTLTVTSPQGIRHISKTLSIVAHPTSYNNPYAGYTPNGSPPVNPQVTLPTPNDTLADKIIHTQPATRSTSTLPASRSANAQKTIGPYFIVITASFVVLLLALIGGFIIIARKRRRQPI